MCHKTAGWIVSTNVVPRTNMPRLNFRTPDKGSFQIVKFSFLSELEHVAGKSARLIRHGAAKHLGNVPARPEITIFSV